MKRSAARFAIRPGIPDMQRDGNDLMRPLTGVSVGDRWLPFLRLRYEDLRDAPTENKLLGYLDAPNGGPLRCYARAERDGWRHLFTMGPEYARFEVADAGRLQIAIRERDLLRGRFDRVCGIFDPA